MTSAQPTKARVVRPGKLVCVLGSNFAHGGNITQFCDYLIYPDLMASQGNFMPLYGSTSWEAFKQATLVSQVTCVAGVSFSLNQLGQAGSTVDQIPNMAPQLSNLVQMRIQAMGVLNFIRHKQANTASLLNGALKALADAVQGQQHAMTFLGVWLYNKKAVNDFVAEVMGMQESVDTIILQTHMSEPFFSNGSCVARPVSLMSSSEELPTFALAEEAARALWSGTQRFRILLSSVLGAFLYVTRQNASINMDCIDASIVDLDVVCSTNFAGTTAHFDPTDKYQYLTYTPPAGSTNANGYVASHETVSSLNDKVDMFVSRHLSEGWAVFEVQRDRAGQCANASDYQHLMAAAAKAKQAVP
ncbi:uncharacterized protein LOC144180447 [Haemaphysalis longicornis]